MSDFTRLIRWCCVLIAAPVAVIVINAAAGTDWAALLVGVVGSAAILAAYRVGSRACDRLDEIEDLEACWVMPSYQPLGLAEEWGYTSEDGAA